MNTDIDDTAMERTDQEDFPPQFATITVGADEFTAPVNLLDLTVASLTSQGASRDLAVAIVAKGLKLYTHGKADLGYGITATIRNQL